MIIRKKSVIVTVPVEWTGKLITRTKSSDHRSVLGFYSLLGNGSRLLAEPTGSSKEDISKDLVSNSSSRVLILATFTDLVQSDCKRGRKVLIHFTHSKNSRKHSDRQVDIRHRGGGASTGRMWKQTGQQVLPSPEG